MMFYRTDLFEAANLTMPERPTWTQVAEYAAALHKEGEVNGLCLRGLPGWSSFRASARCGTTRRRPPSC